MTADVRVLVVEDQPELAELHRISVDRVPGFVTVATARTGQAALAAVRRTEIELVLLDLYLPDAFGLDLLSGLRSGLHPVDVIAVTSARDLPTVQGALSAGVVHYLLKPFSFAMLQDKLLRYREYREVTDGGGAAAGQHQVDALFATLHGPGPVALPKNLRQETLDLVAESLAALGEASATDVADRSGVSRVTARRYLAHLVEVGVAEQSLRYGGAGRPEVLYRAVDTARRRGGA